MTWSAPHAIWLIAGLLLFGLSLGSSISSGWLLRRKNNELVSELAASREELEQNASPNSLPVIAAPADSPESDVDAALALAGDLCAFLLANDHKVNAAPIVDPYAGLGDYPDDPEIRDHFVPQFSERVAEAKQRIGGRGILDESCRASNIGEILGDTSVTRAEDVRAIIECLVLAAKKIKEKFLTGKPFVLVRPGR